MAEDPLHDIIEAVRLRLKPEMDVQIQSLTDRHQLALDEQRTRLEAEAEERLQQQLAHERARAEARLEEERRAGAEQLEQALQSFESGWSQQVASQRGAGADSAALPSSGTLLQGLRDIDAADSISGSLAAIVRAAASETRRVTLYVANGSRLEPWPAIDGEPPNAGAQDNEAAEPMAIRAFEGREAVRHNGSACAIPLLLDGVAVGVLYGEADPEVEGASDWTATMEAVARHGAARVGYLTALRTAQARQWLNESTTTTTAASSTLVDHNDTAASARRYARLVVSEIKLYNESAVEEGRSGRNLLTRLGPEIDRARRLYEQHVPASVPARSGYFQQELIQTLAGGDASLLG